MFLIGVLGILVILGALFCISCCLMWQQDCDKQMDDEEQIKFLKELNSKHRHA